LSCSRPKDRNKDRNEAVAIQDGVTATARRALTSVAFANDNDTAVLTVRPGTRWRPIRRARGFSLGQRGREPTVRAKSSATAIVKSFTAKIRLQPPA
jgi:hypothetical protein